MRKYVLTACALFMGSLAHAEQRSVGEVPDRPTANFGFNESITRLCKERYAPTVIQQGPTQGQPMPGAVHTAANGNAMRMGR